MRHRVRPKHLAAKLRAVRKRLGLSQSQLAARLSFDIENGRISDYELGKRQPNVLLLLDYARLAGIHIDDLVDDEIELKFKPVPA
jgi:transcriptional regulator with XRE-family HTH domain